MRYDAACLDLLLWEVKGSCQRTQNTSRTMPPLTCWDKPGGGEGGGGRGERKSRLASFLPVCVPCACQSNILKQHMQGFATANYPALGTGTEKHLRRTIKRAWLVVRAVSKCWQIVIFNEYTALEWPIKRSLSEHCSFVQSINFLCNSQISCSQVAIRQRQRNNCISLSICVCPLHHSLRRLCNAIQYRVKRIQSLE